MFATTSRRLLSHPVSNGLHLPTRTLLTTASSTTRRYSSSSSSKPSRNGFLVGRSSSPFRRKMRQMEPAKPVSTVQNVKAEAEAATTSQIQPALPESTTLPSVPSTNYLYQSDIAISTFFALHRPVSILFPVPGEYSPTIFSTIFDQATPTSLIEKHQRQYEIQAKAAGTQTESIDAEDALSYANTATTKASPAVRKAVAESPIQLPNHVLVAKYQPFQPPLAPKPMPAWSIASHGSLQQMLDEMHGNSKENPLCEIGNELPRFEWKDDKLVSTSDGSFDGNSLFERTPAEERGALRRQIILRRREFEEMQREGYLTLSVKRQRRLKMKKHKYKKLMKKTRSLRRKLEKT